MASQEKELDAPLVSSKVRTKTLGVKGRNNLSTWCQEPFSNGKVFKGQVALSIMGAPPPEVGSRWLRVLGSYVFGENKVTMYSIRNLRPFLKTFDFLSSEWILKESLIYKRKKWNWFGWRFTGCSLRGCASYHGGITASTWKPLEKQR